MHVLIKIINIFYFLTCKTSNFNNVFKEIQRHIYIKIYYTPNKLEREREKNILPTSVAEFR